MNFRTGIVCMACYLHGLSSLGFLQNISWNYHGSPAFMLKLMEYLSDARRHIRLFV